jgi:polyisoprenoid-binding protein YceI
VTDSLIFDLSRNPPMNLRTFVLLAFLVTVPILAMQTSPTPEPTSTWTIDATHSSAMFGVQHLGAGRFWGRFDSVTGEVVLNASGVPMLAISIPIDSVHSGNAKLDAHLMSPDFFNEKEFPTMSFASSSATVASPHVWNVMGELTMLGATHPVTARAELVGRKDMGRGERIGLEVTFTLTRSQWGMTYGIESGSLGDAVKVIVGIEATE